MYFHGIWKFGDSEVFRAGSDRDLEKVMKENSKLGGGFKYFLFSPLPGEDSQFD